MNRCPRSGCGGNLLSLDGAMVCLMCCRPLEAVVPPAWAYDGQRSERSRKGAETRWGRKAVTP